jgi:hypothetical protein
VRVLVEGDEDQALVELAGGVAAAVVVVAAADDALVVGRGRTRVGQADVGVDGDALALAVEVVASILALRVPPSGAPVERTRSIIVSGSRSPTRAQNSTCMRMVRTAWYRCRRCSPR